MFTFMMRVSRIHRCLQVIFFFLRHLLLHYFRVMVFWGCEYLSTLSENAVIQAEKCGTEKKDTDENDVKTYVQTEEKAAKEMNIFISIELDLWGNHLMQKQKTKSADVKMWKCHSKWNRDTVCVCLNVCWKNKLRQTCFILVAAYLHELCTLHFTLFMIQRRAQMLCQNTQQEKNRR